MDNNGEVVYLYLDDIIPNRFQPREVFDDQALKELAVSIKEHGVIQPIIVRKVENKYEIIAGERRYKASTMAGLTKIPAIVKNLDDKESSKVALIENLQRKDLSPIEEARTYQKILELENEMTQEQLAATLGKTQSSVSNKLRLLDLPDEIQDALLKEKISERHARSLLSIDDKNEQIKMMDKVVAEKMTVRELDKEIKEMKGEAPSEEAAPAPSVGPSFEPITPVVPIAPVESVTEQPVVEQSESIDTPSVVPVDFGSNVQTDVPSVLPAEETTPPVAAIPNPTSVDIDKIRETSTDINLVNNESNVVNTEPVEQDGFKFVPSFGGDTPSSEPAQETSFGFNQFFNPNTQEEPVKEENSSIASAMPTPEISVPTPTTGKDISQAITDVKNTITGLQNDGFNVSFEETDSPTDYKISIVINKE